MDRFKFLRGLRALFPKYRKGERVLIQDRFGSDYWGHILRNEEDEGENIYLVQMDDGSLVGISEEDLDEHNDEGIYFE